MISRQDREIVLCNAMDKGLSVPLHWLTPEAQYAAERLQLKGLAQVYCDEACVRYLVST